MEQNSFRLHAGLTIYKGEEVFLTPTHIRLLKQVIKDGSIHAASKNLKMSYQHAWHLLDKLNNLSPLPVLLRQKGGRDGGGCVVSNYGLKLINTFDAREMALSAYLSQDNMDLDQCFF